jgi:hypothetical protein
LAATFRLTAPAPEVPFVRTVIHVDAVDGFQTHPALVRTFSERGPPAADADMDDVLST